MQKINFSIFINAPRQKVWDTMLGDSTYRVWTKPFSEGSYFKGNWSEGGKILFLGPNPENGEEGGMVSFVRENRQYEFISIEHVGLIKNGIEDLTSEEVKKWTPAFENYTFLDKNGGTEVVVDIDVNDEYKTMFEEMWPKSLQILKQLSEK